MNQKLLAGNKPKLINANESTISSIEGNLNKKETILNKFGMSGISALNDNLAF